MDWKLLITSFITMVVIVDPIGNTPVFLALTSQADAERRRHFAGQAVIAATSLIFIFAFFGHYILDYLGISLESLMVAGGVLLGIVALDMMKGRINAEDEAVYPNVALVPIGTPLLAGPGAVVAAMLLMSQQESVSGKTLAAAGILAALIVVWVALRLASQLLKLLKPIGVDLFSRIMGILLAAIAVEFIHEAVVSWIG